MRDRKAYYPMKCRTRMLQKICCLHTETRAVSSSKVHCFEFLAVQNFHTPTVRIDCHSHSTSMHFAKHWKYWFFIVSSTVMKMKRMKCQGRLESLCNLALGFAFSKVVSNGQLVFLQAVSPLPFSKIVSVLGWFSRSDRFMCARYSLKFHASVRF